jgi:hypothetical protein
VKNKKLNRNSSHRFRKLVDAPGNWTLLAYTNHRNVTYSKLAKWIGIFSMEKKLWTTPVLHRNPIYPFLELTFVFWCTPNPSRPEGLRDAGRGPWLGMQPISHTLDKLTHQKKQMPDHALNSTNTLTHTHQLHLHFQFLKCDTVLLLHFNSKRSLRGLNNLNAPHNYFLTILTLNPF